MRPSLSAAVLCLSMMAATPGAAQVITGSILGNVSDPSSSAVAGAKVTARNIGTNVSTIVSTSTSGEYTLTYLPTGMYEVTIEAPGFKGFRQTNVNLGVDSKVRVDVQLQVGSVTESVEVVGTAQVLQTDSSDLNTTFSQPAIQSLPNISRNPLSYVRTVQGVVTRSGFESVTNSATSDEGRRQFTNFSVNGSQPLNSEILLDGAPNTNAALNEIAVLPNLDAIGDLKIITSAYSAEFGRVAGGVVIFNTKSGTNQFRGSLYEYFRNPVLNANSFGNNSFGNKPDGRPARPKGKFNHNQFGGSFSGPVILPKFNGRDKTFFFFSYEGVRRVADASATITLPTALERAGDFSQSRALVRDAGGQNILVPRDVYNPYPSATTMTQVGVGNFRLNRQQFQDGGVLNRIPRQFINPVAQRFLNFYPLPNITPQQPDGRENYFDSNSSRVRTDQIIAKVDHNFSPKHRTFFRQTVDWTSDAPPNRFRTTNPDAADEIPITQFNPSSTLGHTWTVSPSSIVDLRANLTRTNMIRLPESGLSADLGGLGFSPSMASAPPAAIFPRMEMSGFQPIGPQQNYVLAHHYTNLAFSGSYTKVLSRWTIKGGGEYRPQFNNVLQPSIASIGLTAQNFTRECAGSGCPALPPARSEGYSVADFLIGALDGLRGNGQFTTGDPVLSLKIPYYSLYSQNDWKVSRKLTLNLGVRWELQGGTTERYNRLGNFDRNRKNVTGTPGRYLFPGTEGLSRSHVENDYRNWGPRVGLAYRLTGRTVIRSAYGITYAALTGGGTVPLGYGIDGFNALSFMRIRPVSNLDILERPFQDSLTIAGVPIGAKPDDPRILGGAVIARERYQRTPYVQQWNLTIERELPAGIDLQVSYLGTKGTRLIMQQLNINADNSIPEPLLQNARSELIRTGVNPLNALVPNPFVGVIVGNVALSGPMISRLNLSRPFPAYGRLRYYDNRWGSSNYHSLQVNARRSFRQGLEIGGNYVWSKNIDFGNSRGVNNGNAGNGGGGDGFTVNNFHIERSVANSDVPHRAVLYYIAELPFGAGKPFLARSPVVRQIVSGWKVAGVTIFSAGLPISITGGGFGRPDLIGDPVLPKEFQVIGNGVTAYPLPDGTKIVVPNRRLLYFNPRAFRNRVIETPRAGATGTQLIDDVYWYGTAPRFLSSVRTWGINNSDLTLSRDFRIKESLKVELRAEAFNVFNRKEFSDASVFRTFGLTNLVSTRGALGESTNADFGMIDITQSGRTPRYIQLSLRVVF